MQKLSGKSGMTRGEILDVSGIDDNATFVKAMKELEQYDFIRKFTVIGKTYNAM